MAMSGLQLRDARASDRGAIEAVTPPAFQEYAASKSNRWEDYRHGILAALAAVQPRTQIVAKQNSEIIGSVLLYSKGTVIAIPGSAPITLSWPEVRLLAVAPAARGQGVGAALMQECVQRARHSGARALALHTADIKNAALRLYERMGFQRAPELDFEPAPGVTAKGYLLALEETDS
jgi:ribosomal protein S18 acetylase RimI-like enzyme